MSAGRRSLLTTEALLALDELFGTVVQRTDELVTQGQQVTHDLSQQTSEASALALRLNELSQRLFMVETINNLENGLLLQTGYMVSIQDGLRVLRVTSNGPLAFRTNEPQGTTTIVALDPAMFGVRVGSDGTRTLYRS